MSYIFWWICDRPTPKQIVKMWPLVLDISFAPYNKTCTESGFSWLNHVRKKVVCAASWRLAPQLFTRDWQKWGWQVREPAKGKIIVLILHRQQTYWTFQEDPFPGCKSLNIYRQWLLVAMHAFIGLSPAPCQSPVALLTIFSDSSCSSKTGSMD